MNSQTINKETPAPKVSVLVPVYRPREEYLRACIDSILSQTFRDFELLLLDDCPEDRTAEAVIKTAIPPAPLTTASPRNLPSMTGWRRWEFRTGTSSPSITWNSSTSGKAERPVRLRTGRSADLAGTAG